MPGPVENLPAAFFSRALRSLLLPLPAVWCSGRADAPDRCTCTSNAQLVSPARGPGVALPLVSMPGALCWYSAQGRGRAGGWELLHPAPHPQAPGLAFPAS